MEEQLLIDNPKKNNFLIMLLSGLLLIACIVAGFLAWKTQKLVKDLSDFRSQKQVTLTPTPKPTTDPTYDWKTVSNLGLGYQIKLPDDWKAIEHSSSFNEVFQNYQSSSGQRIEIIKDKIPRTICKGDCPIIQNTTKTDLEKYEAIKYEGYVGEIGGNIAHQYITYNISNSDYSLDITYHPSTIGKKPGNDIVSINSQEIELFNQILSTFKFILEKNVACTEEAKMCPDGSYVGRVGPNCEFSPCP